MLSVVVTAGLLVAAVAMGLLATPTPGAVTSTSGAPVEAAGPIGEPADVNVQRLVTDDLLVQTGKAWTLGCMGRPLDVKPNATIMCTGTAADGSTSTITLMIDAAGMVTYSMG